MYQFQLFFTYMYMYFLTKSKKMDANYNLGQTLFSDVAFDLELTVLFPVHFTNHCSKANRI